MTRKEKAEQLALTLIGEDQSPQALIDVLVDMAEWQHQEDRLAWGYEDSMLIGKVNSSLLGYAREERDQGFTRHADELERRAKMILELAPKNAWRPTLLQINMIRELNETIKTDCPKWADVFDAFTKEMERL